ncbi:hypothetical protein MHK_001945, partial [Candidatus Magnetomorum sp. HK-1]
YIKQMNITHILIRTDIADSYLKERYSQEERDLLNQRILSQLKLIYLSKGYALWQIGY